MKVKTKLPIPLGGGEAELEMTKEEGSATKRVISTFRHLNHRYKFSYLWEGNL